MESSAPKNRKLGKIWSSGHTFGNSRRHTEDALHSSYQAQRLALLSQPGKSRARTQEYDHHVSGGVLAVLYDYGHKGAAASPRHEHRQITAALLASEAESAKRLAETLEIEGTCVVPFINAILREIYDTDCLRLAEPAEPRLTEQTEPVSGKKVWLTTTQLGKRLGLTPHRTNKLLQERGLIEPFRNRKGQLRWKPTAKGKPHITGKGAKRNPDSYEGVHQLFFSDPAHPPPCLFYLAMFFLKALRIFISIKTALLTDISSMLYIYANCRKKLSPPQSFITRQSPIWFKKMDDI